MNSRDSLAGSPDEAGVRRWEDGVLTEAGAGATAGPVTAGEVGEAGPAALPCQHLVDTADPSDQEGTSWGNLTVLGEDPTASIALELVVAAAQPLVAGGQAPVVPRQSQWVAQQTSLPPRAPTCNHHIPTGCPKKRGNKETRP